jgi:hypothetical protein
MHYKHYHIRKYGVEFQTYFTQTRACYTPNESEKIRDSEYSISHVIWKNNIVDGSAQGILLGA